MSVLDLTRCPICHAPGSLARQTTQLETRAHVTYECLVCGTLLVWLGDEMWLEADRWSFQQVGRPERADLLYKSMTVAELRRLAGDQPPAGMPAPTGRGSQPKAPPVWIDLKPEEKVTPAARPEPAARAEEQPPEERAPEAPPAGPPQAEEPEPEPPAKPAATPPIPSAAEPEPPDEEPEIAEPEPREPVVEMPPIVAEPPEEGPAKAEPGPAKAEPEPTEPAVEKPEIVAEPPAEGPAIGEPGAVTAQPEPAQPPVQAVAPETHKEPVSVAPLAESRQQPASRRRRSRGSPFLVISVGFVLLFLICSAAVMILYSTISNWPGVAALPTNPPAAEVAATETATPTQTPIPTDTPAATETPAPTDTPTPTPSPVPGEPTAVEFQGVTDYLAASGSHYLVGEVLNETADSLRFVEVLATFYDDAGQVVGTGSTFTELSIVKPGSSAPFKLTTLNPPQVGNYDLRVDYATTTQSPITLELLGHTGATDDSGWYRVTGEVRNPHDFAVKFPEIVATFYNATHDVLRVEGVFAEADLLEPGQVSSFEVVVTEPPADLHYYALQTEAVRQ
jgi:hypothetical protein